MSSPAERAVAFPGQGIPVDDVVATLEAHGDEPLIAELRGQLAVADSEGWAQVDFTDARVAQPCIYCAGLVRAQRYLEPGEAAVVLGHSLGEITAAAFAGAIEPSQGLELVRKRATICHQAHTVRPGAMAAVMGLSTTEVEWLRRRATADTGLVLEVAAINGRAQVVVSGDVTAVERLTPLVAEAEGLVARLGIGGSYHSPLLACVIEEFREAVESAIRGDTVVDLLSTTDLRRRRGGAELAEALVRALLLPVRWHDALLALREQGIEEAWDVGPGETLGKLARRSKVVLFRAVGDAA